MSNRDTPHRVSDNHRFQSVILAGISPTFALVIPRLPASLKNVVADVHPLNRIADAIEGDPATAPGVSHVRRSKVRDPTLSCGATRHLLQIGRAKTHLKLSQLHAR